MTKINDGGQAFPNVVQRWNDRLENQDGMTLRDWFAGQALPAACTLAFANIKQASSMDLLPEEWASKIALSVADAMLAAREVAK